MHISRIIVKNFRNFKLLDVSLAKNAVIVGENKVGKTNLLHAIRLVLDPSLPENARQLRDEDFWDGLPRIPNRSKDVAIEVSIEFSNFEDDDDVSALLNPYVIEAEPMVSRITYSFSPDPSLEGNPTRISQYSFALFGGGSTEHRVTHEVRQRLPLIVLKALRDAENDLESWRKSPMRPILESAGREIPGAALERIASKIDKSARQVTKIASVKKVEKSITSKISTMVGARQGIDTRLGVLPESPDGLLRTLRLLIDSGKRGVEDASLGSANVLYLALKSLETEQLVEARERNHTFLAIEEPEAHLHPHLQRLVYRNYLKPRRHQRRQEPMYLDRHLSVLLTTHSPHIVSVTPPKSLVLLRHSQSTGATFGYSTAKITLSEKDEQDIERYLDVNRGEILFARAVLLVEGDAELYLVPKLANMAGFDLDELGISVCSVSGVNFLPYIKFIGQNGLNIPFAVLTDYDETPQGDSLGQKRVIKLMKSIHGSQALSNKTRPEILADAPSSGLMLNMDTFEVDLFKAGHHRVMCDVLRELTTNNAAITRAISWRRSPTSLNRDEFINDISAIGKGRFSQRLASCIKGKAVPVYIEKALTYVTSKIE